MYCANCKKEVDINSVAVSKPKRAYTMFTEGGLGMTRVGGGNDKIVNVCKSCGKSEYLWESVEAMLLAAEEEKKKAEDQRSGTEMGTGDYIFWVVAFVSLSIVMLIVKMIIN